jgi:hypothetical protein
MSKTYSGPFDRKVEAVASIAERYAGGYRNDTGDRLADALETIAKGGQAASVSASTAADVAGLKADLNGLIVALKNAGVIKPDELTITVTKEVTDSISGRADRQYNTDQISSIEEEDGIITITLSKKVSQLKDFNAGGNWGVHKWLGFGMSAGITPITGLKYNGASLGAEDVTEATQVGLSSGYFVRWVAADLVVAGDESQASKSTFTLTADGYKNLGFKIKIVEP